MALLRQIKASPFLSAIDGLPPALQQRLGYSRKQTSPGRYYGHLQAYFLHDMAFTKAYNDKIERIRKTGAYEPATPLQPGLTRTSNTMSATGYVDKPTVCQSGLWAVVKGMLGFDVIHIPSGTALLLGVRKDRARIVMDILHEIAPNYAYDATLGKVRGYIDDDAELLTFWDAYKRAELAGTEDALLTDTVAGFETRDSVRAEFEVPATVATDLNDVAAWLSKARDPRFYVSEVAAAKCWNGRTFVVRGRDNLQRVVEGLTAFAAMAENRYAAEGLRKLAEKVAEY